MYTYNYKNLLYNYFYDVVIEDKKFRYLLRNLVKKEAQSENFKYVIKFKKIKFNKLFKIRQFQIVYF